MPMIVVEGTMGNHLNNIHAPNGLQAQIPAPSISCSEFRHGSDICNHDSDVIQFSTPVVVPLLLCANGKGRLVLLIKRSAQQACPEQSP